MKKQEILTLIESDIANTRLINGLNDIGIDLSSYSLDLDTLIFKGVGLKKHARTEELYKKYFELLKQGKTIHPNDRVQLRKLALKIYRFLLRHL